MDRENDIDFNDYCFYGILDEIKNICEITANGDVHKTVKYSDLINFAVAFRNVFYNWNRALYDDLDIEKIFLSNEDVFIDFNRFYEAMLNQTQKNRDKFWNMIINALMSNTILKSITLQYIAEAYNADHSEIFERIMLAIRNKPCLETLNINMKGYSLDSLKQLHHIKHLSINMRMDATELAEHCESNPNLISLEFKNNEIYGKLTDIVPHCNKLKRLAFTVKPDFSESEYTPLAKLPKLSYLRIEGKHEPSSLNTLFDALAAKEETTLTEMMIDTPEMDCEEIVAVSQLQSLNEFKYKYKNDLKIVFNENFTELNLSFIKSIDTSDLAFLANFPTVKSLNTYRKHRTGTLKPLFNAFALQQFPTLERFSYESLGNFRKHTEEDEDEEEIDFNALFNSLHVSKEMEQLNNEEMMELLKIKSLKIVDCIYSDSEPIEFPTQLPQIKKLRLSAVKGGLLLNLFRAFALQKSSKLADLTIYECPISLEETIEISKIESITFLKCDFSNFECIQYLSQLGQLKNLTTSTNSKENVYDLSVACSKLFVACDGKTEIHFAHNTIKMESNTETLKLTMNSSINLLVFVPLASLHNIRSLEISGDYEGDSLTQLLEAFAQSTFLEYLLLDLGPISYNAVEQVAKMETLKYFECSFKDPQSIKLLNLPKLEGIKILSDHQFCDISQGVLNILASGSHEVSVIQYDQIITLNKIQGKLTISNITSCDPEDYASLAELLNLRTLHIKAAHKRVPFKGLFKKFNVKEFGSLHELILDTTSSFEAQKLCFNLEEIEEVAKISSLKRIKCGVSDLRSMELLANGMDLQDLVITDHPEGSLEQFARTLTSRGSSSLQSLIVKDHKRRLTCGEIEQIARVQSLKRLECEFNDRQNIELLAQLNHLEELIIERNESDSLENLFRALAYKSLRYLNIEKISISYEEMMAVVGIKSLRKLHCKLTDPKLMELLVQITELEDLSLTCDDSDTAICIESLALPIKLTGFKISVPFEISRTGLFKELSLKEEPILQSLVIENECVSCEEITLIVQLKSLRVLTCRIDKVKDINYLINLPNLEELQIMSAHDFDEISPYLMSILQKCCNLKAINCKYIKYISGVSLEFLREAVTILKTVRNPTNQNPLQLRFRWFKGLTPEQMAVTDANYLIVSKFIDN